MKFLTLSLISVVAITASTLADDSLFFDDPSGLLASNDVNWQDPRPAASLNPGLYATDNVSPNLYVIGDCHPLGQNQPAGKLRARQGILCPNNVAAPPKENPQNQKIDEPNADNSNLIQNPVANPAPPVVEKNEEVCNQQVVAKRPYAVCDSGKYTDRIYKPMTMGSDLRNCEILDLLHVGCFFKPLEGQGAPGRSVWCCQEYDELDGIGFGTDCLDLLVVKHLGGFRTLPRQKS